MLLSPLALSQALHTPNFFEDEMAPTSYTLVYHFNENRTIGHNFQFCISQTGIFHRVVDGDTLHFIEEGKTKGTNVRLAGIDAPEKDQPLGRKATEFVKVCTHPLYKCIVFCLRNTAGPPGM
ncbi:MAG: hypothetical protein ABGY11_04430 [Candidatus Thioglobus sp.]